MVEHSGDYEWRVEGEEAELVIYASAPSVAEAAFERISWITRLPGVESPVYAAASPAGLGWAAVSASHVAPDLTSVPARGLLLVADVPAENLGVPPKEVMNLILRDFGEVGLPPLNEAGVRRICEEGAPAAAEDGLIEEEDLPLLDPAAGDADALGRRALTAGLREWDGPIEVDVTVVADILDAEGAETLGLEQGMLARRGRATSAGSLSPRTGRGSSAGSGAGRTSARRTTCPPRLRRRKKPPTSWRPRGPRPTSPTAAPPGPCTRSGGCLESSPGG
jgi:tRNA-splicing ligase RtcB (3'-phosphate/5'-hydroxy nucleic acid ligase)